MTGSECSHDGPSWFGRMVRDGWLVGTIMLVIVCAIASPFVMPFFGYGVPYHGAGIQDLPLEPSDAFTIFGAVASSWCMGWAVTKLVDRWIARKGRMPSGWIRFLAPVALYAMTSLLFYLIPLKAFYARDVATFCAILAMSMALHAVRPERDVHTDPAS